MDIIGNKFLVEFEMAKAVLHIESETSLTFTTTELNGNEVNTSETVEIKMTEIRPQLFLVTWKEASGKTITQVQDYEKETIYSNWTLTDGEFINRKGALRKVDK